MRRLLIIRHAIAFERNRNRWPKDNARPLTGRGKKKFRAVARHMKQILRRPDELLTSSLKRAKQTAHILSEVAGYPTAEELPELKPNATTMALLDALDSRRGKFLAIVGHEPALSSLISQLLAGSTTGVKSRLKKGGVALLQFDDRLKDGSGKLLMFAPPRLLR